jgi:hypothetical protein
MTTLNTSDVLRYRKGRGAQSTVRRHFLKWCAAQVPSVPYRCDVASCHFHVEPPFWNGKELRLILDHRNGVCGDNRHKNLRFLCPNCNSQERTHGGGNKGRVIQDSGGFAKVRSDGKRDYTLPADTGSFIVKDSDVVLRKR